MVTVKDQGIGQAVGAGESRRRKSLLVIRHVLLVAGIALLGVFVGARIHSAILSHMAILSFDASQAAATPKARGETAPDTNVDFTLWSEKRIDAYKQSLAQRWLRPLAVLRVAKIHLEAPVLEGTDDLTLNRGLGRIVDTAKLGELGNVGIAGHRDGFFRGLKDVGVGDRLELSLPNRTEAYVVDSVKIVNPSDVSVLEPTTEPSLTLVTCYPFYFIGSAPQRYIVHASIVHSEPVKNKVSEQAIRGKEDR
jgi:sortase A